MEYTKYNSSGINYGKNPNKKLIMIKDISKLHSNVLIQGSILDMFVAVFWYPEFST